MKLDFAGKVFLISGAGAGIGLATARMAAEAGADVACADVSAAGAEAAAAVVRAAGRRALALRCDVSSEADVRATCERTVSELGRLDVLLNSAATFSDKGAVTEVSLQDWTNSLNVNVTGVFLMCKHAIPRMVAGGGGVVVNIGSVLGHVASPNRIAYCAHKGAVLSMTRAMAVDHAKQGVRVVSVSPGPVGTERYLQTYGSREVANKARGADSPMGRIAETDEVAGVIMLLASGHASYVTGADLLVDGGICAK